MCVSVICTAVVTLWSFQMEFIQIAVDPDFELPLHILHNPGKIIASILSNHH